MERKLNLCKRAAVYAAVAFIAAQMVTFATSPATSPTITLKFVYYFLAAMLGHFVGDYVFQNQWMATEKSFPGKRGHIACTVHVASYTLAIAMFTGWHPLFLLVVAAPHWIIDRWSLAIPILEFKNGYNLHNVWEKAPLCAANSAALPPEIAGNVRRAEEEKLIKNVWKVSFAAPVYIFNDNTLHWVCLWFTVMYFFTR